MLQFAERHLQPYILRGNELIPRLCPFCHGGERQDTNTFALNLREGVFICQRGKCGVRGRFSELAKRFGESEGTALNGEAVFTKRLSRQYTLPDIPLYPPTDEIISYFESRKISKETLDAW